MTTATTLAHPGAAKVRSAALPLVRVRRRRSRQRYRYSLTTIDVMFASVAQSPEVERMLDRQDHRAELYALGVGMIVLVVASVGTAFGLRQLIVIASSFLS